jgi:hypothetical protein
VNWSANEVVEVPPGELMVTSTVPADSPGEVAVQLVVEEQITAEAEVVPKSISVSPAPVEKPVPVIVTEVRPETGPEMGETPVTVGGEGGEEGGEDGGEGGEGEEEGGEEVAVHWA